MDVGVYGVCMTGVVGDGPHKPICMYKHVNLFLLLIKTLEAVSLDPVLCSPLHNVRFTYIANDVFSQCMPP